MAKLGVVALLLGSAAATPASTPSTEPRPDLEPLAARVRGWVEEGVYPGAALMVGRGNEVLLERYFGAYRPDTQVNIASAGKWLAAATIAAVVDEGRLRWDDRAGQWIPELTGPMAQATLRQLLSHTAGYPDYQPEDQPRDHYQTLAESVARIVPLPPDAQPGAKFRYGGLAMQVAGRMAERATGQNWDTIFQTRVARPLGMTGTGFAPVPAEPGFSPMLGGSAHTTLRDFGRFLRMVASGDGSVISAASLAEMERDQVGSATLMPGEYVDLARARRFTGVYGLGEWREERDATGQASLLSSPGWAGAYPWVDKRTGTWGFVLAKVNVDRAKVAGFSSFLAGSVLPSLARDAIDDVGRGWRHGYAAVPGGRLYWEEVGSGPPMILLHGHSLDRTMWDLQMATFSQHFRVIRYDLRGYGRSTLPTEGENRLHAEDLKALMDDLGIPRAHLVGLSLGGTVALDMLALHPDRLLSVTAASGDVFNSYPAPTDPWTADAKSKRQAEIAAVRSEGVQHFKRRWLDDLTSRGGGCVDAIRPELWNQIAKWSAWQPTHSEPRLLLGRSLIGHLRRSSWHAPVQILTGDADSWRPNRLIAAFPHVPQVVVPNSGHMMNMENPIGFNSAVVRFVTTGKTGPISSISPCHSVDPA